MSQVSRYFYFYILWFLVSSCTTQTNAQIPPDEEAQQYKSKGVKEVFIEVEQFYYRKVTTPKHLDKHLVIDKNGRTIRWEKADDNKMTYRQDIQFDDKGAQVSYTGFLRIESEIYGERKVDPNIPLNKINWVPSERYRDPSENKKGGTENWNGEENKWETYQTEQFYIKNDTACKVTKGADNKTKKIERNYLVKPDKNLYRTDILTYTVKGLREPTYRYSKKQNGKIDETGKVDFEMELYTHLEKNPADRLRILGAHHYFYSLLDQVARKYPGTLKPTGTFTYNEAGQLTEQTSYDNRIAYTRDKTGRLLSEEHFYNNKSGHTITYSYNEKGLLEKATKTATDGTTKEVLYYTYRYL